MLVLKNFVLCKEVVKTEEEVLLSLISFAFNSLSWWFFSLFCFVFCTQVFLHCFQSSKFNFVSFLFCSFFFSYSTFLRFMMRNVIVGSCFKVCLFLAGSLAYVYAVVLFVLLLLVCCVNRMLRDLFNGFVIYLFGIEGNDELKKIIGMFH